MKARKIKHLDPAAPFGANAVRIVSVRTQEVLDLGARAQDPRHVKPLHDLRIAVKRLRYLLELTGPEAPVKQLKRLQDLLGEIHDCDVQLPPLRAAGARGAGTRGRRPADARHPPGDAPGRALRALPAGLAPRSSRRSRRFHTPRTRAS